MQKKLICRDFAVRCLYNLTLRSSSDLLVTALCESSEEIMDVDSAPVSVIEQEQDADSDIAVMACNREAPVYPPQLAGGRAMTFDLDTCGEERARCPYGQAGLIGSTFDPSDSLVDWFVGSPPTRTYTAGDPEHHIANCSQLEPKPYSPMSPPLIYQGPSGITSNDQWSEDLQRIDS